MTSSNGRYAFPLPPRLQAIPGVQPLELEVAEVSELGPRMRRIRLTGPALEDFAYRPNQDVMLVLGGSFERPLSRRYTIRAYDARTKTLELNITAHGIHGPGAEWAANTQSGDRINGVGPRGKIFLNPDAHWHLFVGDESAAPGSLAMLEALPATAPGMAILEVTGKADELDARITSSHTVTWLHRGDQPAWSSERVLEALESAQLPAGTGHAYIAGEVQFVADLQRAALARGFAPEQVSAKPYWGRTKANANNGEPEREV